MEVGKVEMAHQKELPFRTMKLFGGVQIGLGSLCIFLNIIGVIMVHVNLSKSCEGCDTYRWDIEYDSSVMLVSAIIPVWFIITGVIPLFMSENRATHFRCQGLLILPGLVILLFWIILCKIGFMVCCIISAAVAVPTVFSFAMIGAAHDSYYGLNTLAISVLTDLIAFVEFVIAIVASSFCCCCSAWGTDPTAVFVVQSQPGGFISLQQSQQSAIQGHLVASAPQPPAELGLQNNSQQAIGTGVPQPPANVGMHNNSQQAFQINFQRDDYHY